MASYTFDVFSTLDGYGSTDEWGGYWGKQGPELLDHRASLYAEDQLMVFGPTTYRMFSGFVLAGVEFDPWVVQMSELPKVVVSRSMTPDEHLPWPNTTVMHGDAVDVVARLKEESKVPLRSHGSLSMNHALMAAGLVDRIQVTIFPVITGLTGQDPIFRGAAEFDLDLIEARTLDGRTQELTYAPTVHPVRPR
ncbi:dihydrofolate reductase family protein [Specibacter cremeus]|uniref:dihydrofolate reductase family protein n=1 Tax=Specibacter cremeus TaxID=1629051 RepID=UPI000F79C59E|nr:dihydrofolate reductase family protein [Specibacter cremeus]